MIHPHCVNTVLIIDINVAGITPRSILKDLLVLSAVYVV